MSAHRRFVAARQLDFGLPLTTQNPPSTLCVSQIVSAVWPVCRPLCDAPICMLRILSVSCLSNPHQDRETVLSPISTPGRWGRLKAPIEAEASFCSSKSLITLAAVVANGSSRINRHAPADWPRSLGIGHAEFPLSASVSASPGLPCVCLCVPSRLSQSGRLPWRWGSWLL